MVTEEDNAGPDGLEQRTLKPGQDSPEHDEGLYWVLERWDARRKKWNVWSSESNPLLDPQTLSDLLDPSYPFTGGVLRLTHYSRGSNDSLAPDLETP